MLFFGFEHLALENLSPLRILYGDAGQGHEPLKELSFVWPESMWVASGYPEHAEKSIASTKRCAQERRFPRYRVKIARWAVVIQKVSQRSSFLALPLAPLI